MEKIFYIFTDGGARGNPGPAAVGFLIQDNRGKILVKRGMRIGSTTNNVAEYMAVIEAWKWLRRNREIVGNGKFQFFLDSLLVVNQLNGLFKVKNKKLQDLIIEVKNLEKEVGGDVVYRFIPREKNKKVHFLVEDSLASILRGLEKL